MGKPGNFGDGDSWSIPVVGALEEGDFIAPVMIQGQGPFLFMLDPRAKSMIDRDVARNLELYVYRTDGRIIDASDTYSEEITDYAEVPKLQVGTLAVNKVELMVRDLNARYNGHPIVGTLGADVFAESLVWTFDRDRQMVHLSTQETAPARPAEAIEVEAEKIFRGKMFVEARVNDEKDVYVYVNFHSWGSAIWPHLIEKIGLISRGDGVWQASSLALGKAEVPEQFIYAFDDKRVRKRDYDGFIGWSYLARFRLTVNWHEETLWLEPRAGLETTVDDRLGRWGDRFDACSAPACLETAVGHEGEDPFLQFTRQGAAGSFSYDVLVEPVNDAGTRMPLPRLLVAFAPETSTIRVTGPEALRYQAATGFRVVDATPFPPPCDSGCVLAAE